MAERVPTEKQYLRLLALGVHYVALTAGRRDYGPLLRRGWVELLDEDNGKGCYPPMRVTADGLRAIATGIDLFGLPESFRFGKEKVADG